MLKNVPLHHFTYFYAFTTVKVWDPTLAWQPIPVHTVPLEEDSLLTRHANCPKFQSLLEDLMDSEEIRAIDSKYQWLYDYLTEKTQQNVTNMNLVKLVNKWPIGSVRHEYVLLTT